MRSEMGVDRGTVWPHVGKCDGKTDFIMLTLYYVYD